MNRQGIRLVALHRFLVPLNAAIVVGVVLELYESPTNSACRITSCSVSLNATFFCRFSKKIIKSDVVVM